MSLSVRAVFVTAALLNCQSGLAQSKTEERIAVVTVCDIILNQAEFNGKTLAVLGRLAASDEGEWLLEDDCKIQANEIPLRAEVWLERRGNLPSVSTPLLDRDSLKIKLAQASKTTKLGKHVQYQCTVHLRTDGTFDGKPDCGWPEVPDQWAIAAGRVEAQDDRRYGHLGGAPAQVLVQGPLVFIDDESQDVPDVKGK